ncbi:MAG: hypothetical protein MK193_00400 [Lentisphaeria bacterium]|nr:hypothetical protein [Lentisphaeria bacterium]
MSITKPFMFLRLAIVFLVLGFGFGVFILLSSNREAPSRSEDRESIRSVKVKIVEASDNIIFLEGHATVRPSEVIQIASEVPGKIIFLNPLLEDGKIIPQNEILLKIDPQDLHIEKIRIEEEIKRIVAEKKLLDSNEVQAKEISESQYRALGIADKELKRRIKLHEEAKVGTLREVEVAEMSFLTTQQEWIKTDNYLKRIPVERESLQAQEEILKAQLQKVNLDLERCVIRAPFKGRVVSNFVENNQLVAVNQVLINFANDQQRELSVPLNGTEVANWMPFVGEKVSQNENGWFGQLEQVGVDIFWLGDVSKGTWKGTLSHLDNFNEENRTVGAVIEIKDSEEDPFSLIPGMFCSVKIPSEAVPNTVWIPRAAINTEENVYIIENGILAEKNVQVIYNMNNQVLVALNEDEASLSDGQILITEKLQSPVNGMKLKIKE